MNMEFNRHLPIPLEVKTMYPITDEIAEIVKNRDKQLKDILFGKDERLILIIGPCSADREDSILDYVCRLRKISEQLSDKIFIIPRVYTNKPRTNGEGYKGMLHQPDPTGKPDLFKGIVSIRQLHMKVISETGFSCADEMLYPENHRYVNDLLGYVTVGARSVENQQHRMTASGLNIPVGMKNPTGGDLSVMLNAINAAQYSQDFIYRGWDVHTTGNEFAHGILRGYINKLGQSLPNYHYEDLMLVSQMYHQAHLKNPAIIVDCNHSNSNKQFDQQPRILKEVLHSCRHNNDIKKLVKGFMIESYIEDGSQNFDGGIYGKSITDPCLGWEKTKNLLFEIADLL